MASWKHYWGVAPAGFFMGAGIPDAVFAYKSRHKPLPLTDLEKMLVVSACGGNTSWQHIIFRGARYAPYPANYSGAAGGRVFPSAAGFQTSQTFFTDDDGLYVIEMRDATAFAERADDGSLNLDGFVDNVRERVHKLQDGRLRIPSEVPITEAHNTWVFNKPSTLLVIPVGDLSQHMLLNVCYMLQNGLVLYDDINKRAVPGIEDFNEIVDVENVWPITFVEGCMENLRRCCYSVGHQPGGHYPRCGVYISTSWYPRLQVRQGFAALGGTPYGSFSWSSGGNIDGTFGI